MERMHELGLHPLPRRPARRAGLGAGGSGSIAIPSTSGVVNAAFQGSLTAQQQQAVLAANADAQTAQGAIALAQAIGGGGAPSDAQVVTGLASVATMFGGPVVGASMAAVGGLVVGFASALQAVFQALGWYDPGWTTYAYNGLLRSGLDPVPYGPTDPSATWINLDGAACGDGVDPVARFLNLFTFTKGGQGDYSGAPFLCVGPQSPSQSIPSLSINTWSYATQVALFAQRAMMENLPPSTQDMIQGASYGGGPCNVKGFVQPPVGLPNQTIIGPYVLKPLGQPLSSYAHPTSFERFFNTLFIKNATLAANGLPFVLPRQLALGAAQAWNAANGGDCLPGAACPASSAKSTCYQPDNQGSPIPWNSPWGGGVPLVRSLLGSAGSYPVQQPDTTLCVNTGGPVAQAPAASGMSGLSIAALSVGGLGAAGAIGVGIYAWHTHQSFGAALKSLFRRHPRLRR
jgi:hypothetical protein